MSEPSPARGWSAGIGAYLIWGFGPVYWRLLGEVPALPLLGYRIAWSAVLLTLLLVGTGSVRDFIAMLRPKVLASFAVAAALLAVNWYTFLYAVAVDRVVEAALGYFINPLLNVLLGTLVLGERLRARQWSAIAVAALGVVVFATQTEGLPWISLVLAGSFAIYGLVRKTAPAEALVGSSLEMIYLLPSAGLLLMLGPGTAAFAGFVPEQLDRGDWILVAGSSLVTVSPLLLFAFAARRLPYSAVGFLQYLAPTCQFLLAVLAFGEPMNPRRLFAFLCIWAAIGLFSVDLLRTRGAAAG